MTMSLTLRSSSKKRRPIIQNGAKDNFHSHRKVMICGNTGIRQLGLDHCRAGIDTVMQDDQLFASFIVENISFFDPAAHTVCIWRVARGALGSGLEFCLRKACGVRKLKKLYDYLGCIARGKIMSKANARHGPALCSLSDGRSSVWCWLDSSTLSKAQTSCYG